MLRLTTLLVPLALILGMLPPVPVAAGDGPLRIGVFRVDVTPPLGSPVAYAPARKIEDPLSARGIVLMGAGGIMSFTNLANGYLADRFGVLPVLALPAAAFLAALLAISLARPALRRLYHEGRLPVEQAVTAGD